MLSSSVTKFSVILRVMFVVQSTSNNFNIILKYYCALRVYMTGIMSLCVTDDEMYTEGIAK